MQQNEIYNIPLPRGPGPKKTKTKRQRTWDKLPRWIKTSDPSRGHKISTRDGSVIDLDLTYKFLGYGSLFVRCVRFEKPNKKITYPIQPPARETLHPRYISALRVANSPGLPTPSVSS
jgi:phage terminase large subunit-like protein